MEFGYDDKTNLLIAKIEKLHAEQVSALLGKANDFLSEKPITIEDYKAAINLMLNDPVLNELNRQKVEAIQLSTNFYFVLSDEAKLATALRVTT